MKTPFRSRRHAACALWLSLLAGCGGGSDGDTLPEPAPTPQPPPAASAVLSGTAATGAALARAAVTVTNSAGRSPCAETLIVTSALGSYTCTLKPAETAPFFVVIADPAGSAAPLVSATSGAPAAGVTMTLNASPLTTALMAQLAADGNPLTLVSGGVLNASALQQLTQNVTAQLANVLAALGAPAGFDLFSTAIVAATAAAPGNAADRLLDLVKITIDPATGRQALSTVDSPAPVALASASIAGAALPAPAAEATTLPQAAQIVAQALTACFTLPVDQRVLARDAGVPLAQGGATVTAMAPACQNIAASAASGAAIDFRHNGYSAGQFFYESLNNPTMTGATFSVPELMAFYAATVTASGQAEAVLNIKYLDASGNPGNLITLARFIPGSSTAARPTNWWLVGNQQVVDINVKVLIRRLEQLNPASSNVSRYQSGLQFVVNAKGPGSLAAAGSLRYARITGPGLPGAGLVMLEPDPREIGQVYMDVLNKTGVLAGSTQCFNCPNFWLARSLGISGAAASTAAPNFNSLNWAPTNQDISGVRKGQVYRIELFHGASAVPSYTVFKPLLSDMVPATRGSLLAWSSLGAASLASLDPANAALSGALSTVTLDWAQNPAAEQIASINVTIDTAGNFDVAARVPRGATSIAITPTRPIPALTNATIRSYLMHYRTTDNSDKNSDFSYN